MWYTERKSKKRWHFYDATCSRDYLHSAIGIGNRIFHTVQQNKKDEALKLIRDKKNNELEVMISLFEAVIDPFKSNCQQHCIIIQDGEKAVALTIDSVESVEMLVESSIESISGSFSSDTSITPCIARRKHQNQIVLIIDCIEILSRINCEQILTESNI